MWLYNIIYYTSIYATIQILLLHREEAAIRIPIRSRMNLEDLTVAFPQRTTPSMVSHPRTCHTRPGVERILNNIKSLLEEAGRSTRDMG